MSYDIYLRSEKCPHCGREDSGPELPDPTYNLTPIFDLALTGEGLPNQDVSEEQVVLFRAKTDRPRGLRILSGKKAKDTEAMISVAVKRMEDPDRRNAFVDLEPDNGWGTLHDALRIMRELLEAARDYPNHTWEIH